MTRYALQHPCHLEVTSVVDDSDSDSDDDDDDDDDDDTEVTSRRKGCGRAYLHIHTNELCSTINFRWVAWESEQSALPIDI